MNKKSMEIGTVFIYALSMIIIALILYFGYRGIAGIYKASEENTLEQLKLNMKADMSQLAIKFGTTASFEYQMPAKFTRLCFADLYINDSYNKTARNNNITDALIKNSISGNLTNNAFLTGESTAPFDIGKTRVECSPFFVCFDRQANKVSFRATGRGTYVLINC